MALTLVQASRQPELFSQLEKFVLPYEKFNVTLYEKILSEDESVYALVGNTTKAVFSYSKGKNFVCCAPRWTQEIQTAIVDFLKDRKVLCVHGEESTVLNLQKILDSRAEQIDERNMFLMEYMGRIYINPQVRVFLCGSGDEEALMPLQIRFITEEILPAWKEINLPLERMNLAKALKNNLVYGAGTETEIFAKANINLYSSKIIQISGVFTAESHRCKGYASSLVNTVALLAQKVGRKATLLVRQENLNAMAAYRKAGFSISGTYKAVYYRDESSV